MTRRLVAVWLAPLLIAAPARADLPRPLLAEATERSVAFIPLGDGVSPLGPAESLSVKNPLGSVRLRGTDEHGVRVSAVKRARSAALLERLKTEVKVEHGRVEITTVVGFSDGSFRAVPLRGEGSIDLVIDAPRGLALQARTFAGEIDAAGFRAGARLSSERGEIHAADLEGPVDTRTLDGRQSLQSIRGRVAASGIDGDLDLESIDGDTIDATVSRGQITAREVRTPVVRLRTTIGTIVFLGPLAHGGRYELQTHDGDVRLTLRAVPFRLVARGAEVRSAYRLVGDVRPGAVSAEYEGGGASLELVSANGRVSIDPLR